MRDWHVGPVFSGRHGPSLLVVEFLAEPADLAQFRDAFDRDLCRRNADYRPTAPGRRAARPASLVVAAGGSFEAWMRSRGKLGGQNKVPRMDSTGTLTGELVEFLRRQRVERRGVELPAGSARRLEARRRLEPPAPRSASRPDAFRPPLAFF